MKFLHYLNKAILIIAIGALLYGSLLKAKGEDSGIWGTVFGVGLIIEMVLGYILKKKKQKDTAS